MKINSNTWKVKTKLYTVSIIICLLSLCQTSKAQSITLYNDSTVLIGLKQYREVRERLILADSLINKSREQITLLELSNEALKEKERLNGLIMSEKSERIKKVEAINSDLLNQLNTVTKKKWYQNPLLYFGSGVVLGVIITR